MIKNKYNEMDDHLRLKSNTKMILKYKIFSKIYDNIFHLMENILFLDKNKNPRYALGCKVPNNNLRILDVCCGTGRGCVPFAKSSDTVTGIDLSPHMLALAEEKINNLQSHNISFLQMDATDMNFSDKEFDVIVSSFGLHEFDYDSMISVLKEMYRVLKEGGKLYVADYGKEDSSLNLIFSVYLKICYPQRVQEFLNYDWDQILSSLGFQFDLIEKYRISRLICATKV
ncbi:MAG: class I SAM-dependent methyltransferase [Desulfobacterales bacterium]|nr:class I SAM-dependent methyltransferase [Desulfobacterales bacterium]